SRSPVGWPAALSGGFCPRRSLSAWTALAARTASLSCSSLGSSPSRPVTCGATRQGSPASRRCTSWPPRSSAISPPSPFSRFLAPRCWRTPATPAASPPGARSCLSAGPAMPSGGEPAKALLPAKRRRPLLEERPHAFLRIGRAEDLEEVVDLELESHVQGDRKSTRLNSSHVKISYAVFCLKKKTNAEYR